MPGVLHRFMILLSIVAFVSEMTTQAIPSAAALDLAIGNKLVKAEPECPRVAMQHPGQQAARG
jgi:hypothetical protein